MKVNNIQTDSCCVYCGGKHSKGLYPLVDMYNDAYFLCKCIDCSAFFISPLPGEKELERAYSSDYYGKENIKFSFSMAGKAVDFFSKRRANKLSSFLHPGARVLDIGCGNGKFLHHLIKKKVCSAYGTERDRKAVSRVAYRQIEMHTGTIHRTTWQKDFFDAVSLFHVFEHLDKPAETLDNIAFFLKRGGTLAISFPNIRSWQAAIFKARWLHLDPPRHLFFFAPDDFIQLMNERGFELTRFSTISAEQNPFGAIQSLLNLICKKRDVLFERLKGNTGYATEYGKLNIFFQKLFFIFTMPFFIITDIIASPFHAGATCFFLFKKK